MEDIYYENQRLYAERNHLPLFASKQCSHRHKWMVGKEKYGKTQTFGEMLIEIYGEEKAAIISSSELITSCPICGRSWCD
jgi:hypothetical protein